MGGGCAISVDSAPPLGELLKNKHSPYSVLTFSLACVAFDDGTSETESNPLNWRQQCCSHRDLQKKLSAVIRRCYDMTKHYGMPILQSGRPMLLIDGVFNSMQLGRIIAGRSKRKDKTM